MTLAARHLGREGAAELGAEELCVLELGELGELPAGAVRCVAVGACARVRQLGGGCGACSGIVPLSLVWSSSSERHCVHRPRSGGIVPETAVPQISR